ncbi:MAG TPA: hypothetical protein PK644_03835, partial [bacterium]|nr:hypothetical protein [bacterium]
MKLIQCPLCGNNDQEPRLVKNGYQIVSCRGCHLFFVNPQPEEGELFCFYQQHQQLYLQQYPRKEIAKRREARRELRRIERLLGRGWISVFDIGCGCGFFLQEAVARGMNARG